MKHFNTLKEEYAHRSQLLADLKSDMQVLSEYTSHPASLAYI